MKKAWRKLSRQELLIDFIMFGFIILLGGGFLLYHIVKVTSSPVLYVEDIRFIGLSVSVIFIIVLLSVFSLYKTSAAYILWYKGILDSIPMPVIVADKDVRWQQTSKAAREIMNWEQGSKLGELNSRHLLDADGGVVKKTLTHKGVEYRITFNRLECGDKDAGYLVFLNNIYGMPGSCETRTGLINEINRLFGRLSTASDQFHDCASTLIGCTVRQADIINELSDVIVGIASGEFKGTDRLNKKMDAVKTDMEQHVESSQSKFETIIRIVNELDTACDSIHNMLHNIDSDP